MAIHFEAVDFTYQADSPFATAALHDVNFTIPEHQFTAVIGHTGSGKSTMVQLLEGLLVPTKGVITVGDRQITPKTKKKELNQLRKHIGMVFQFPEAQLFEQTVLKDVMFGPKNFGQSDTEAQALAQQALRTVGMGPEFDQHSPFELSGGQMRRVAIAGVLAMQPEMLILDEPTAGLDPVGQAELMQLFARLQAERNLTLVLITHQMDFVGQYADHVLVFEQGTVIKEGSPENIFADSDWLRNHQLDLPIAKQFADALAAKEMDLDHVLDLDQLTAQLARALKGGPHE